MPPPPPTTAAGLDALRWDDRFVRELPADPDPSNRRRQVEGAAYSRVAPTPVTAPRTVATSAEVLALLGLDEATAQTQAFADVFAGNQVPDGADPFAMAYAGHQFGSFAGQLGDGRAIALGEVLDVHGGHQTLQLKGAGPTPYSRTADGRAVLRSSVREFLCSEAMHHLGVPTTRALSLVLTGDDVVRDVLYDGHPAPELGAVVCRVAPSFTRFGSFQLPAWRGDLDLLEQLVRFTARHDLPGLADPDGPITEVAAALFAEVARRTADLAVHWMRVGFVHGVLNTDNMSILGLTIDYGPYGWLEGFDPGWTPNTTDAATRRYRFGAQPQVAHWNLAQLGTALATLLDDAAPLQEALDAFGPRYHDGFRAMTAARLGWGAWDESAGDGEVVQALVDLLQRSETDYVLLHRALSSVPADEATGDDELLAPIEGAFYDEAALAADADLRAGWVAWLRTWGARVRRGPLAGDPTGRREAMDAKNPRYVLRNWLAQEAIDQATAGDPTGIVELLDVLRRPYDDQPGRERFAGRRPEWARHRVGCSMLSCSS